MIIYMKSYYSYIIVVLFFLASCRSAKPDPEKIAEAMDARNYMFVVQNITPSGTVQRPITTGDYSLQVHGDSISVFLPFFGRAFNPPPAMQGGGPIQINTKEFEYRSEKKNDRWEILILPSNATDVRQLFLSVSENGYGTLQVVSTSRENISFTGIIEKNKSR
jgi:hypothetical protein